MPQVGRAQIEEAVLVHGASPEDDDVRRRHEPAVVLRDLPQIHRDVVAASLVVLLPVVAREVQAEPVDVFAVAIGVEHRTRLHGQAVPDLDIRKRTDAGAERAVEHRRLTQARTVIQPHTRRNQASRLLR
jgi:hypothetical protein